MSAGTNSDMFISLVRKHQMLIMELWHHAETVGEMLPFILVSVPPLSFFVPLFFNILMLPCCCEVLMAATEKGGAAHSADSVL